MQKRFLIAIDGSPGAQEALRRGIALAREADAAVILAYVRHTPPAVLGAPFYQSALTKELGVGRAVLTAASREASAAGLEVETEILEGRPAERILDLSRSRDADLIVVGSRGRGAMTGALLGSVSESIVHRGDRPVLVVKPRAAIARAA